MEKFFTRWLEAPSKDDIVYSSDEESDADDRKNYEESSLSSDSENTQNEEELSSNTSDEDTFS